MTDKVEQIIVTLTANPAFRQKLRKIFRVFDNFEYIWEEMTYADLSSIGLKDNDYDNLLALRKKGIAKNGWETLKKNDIKVMTFLDKEYPALLREITDPPPVIFYRGNLLYKEGLGMVGPRKGTRYAEQIATAISEKSAENGLAIISGLAIGIDSVCHRGALSGSGKTIAVLGSSIDDNSIYPQTNWSLAQKILDNEGALISEYPPGHPILKMNFPERNRIIAGLSRGVLVVEAREKSGTLITADFALTYGRDVYAVPQDITRPESVGVNNLIKEGAIPVTSYKDVLESFGIEEEASGTHPVIRDSDTENLMLSILHEGPIHIDNLSKRSGLTPQETSSTVSLLEVKGKIINQGAQIFALKK